MATVDEKLEPILAQVLQRNPAEPEFHQAVREVLESLGQVVSKQQLMDQLYGDGEGDPNTLEVLVSRLRKKLDADGQLQPITTIRRQGYLFTLPCQ